MRLLAFAAVALCLSTAPTVDASDSVYAAAAQQRKSNQPSSGGGGSKYNPEAYHTADYKAGKGGKDKAPENADQDKGKGKGKGKGENPKLAEWAKQLRGQLPGKFDDKAAKRIFDKTTERITPSGAFKKVASTVDEYKAKGWHYQMKDDEKDLKLAEDKNKKKDKPNSKKDPERWTTSSSSGRPKGAAGGPPAGMPYQFGGPGGSQGGPPGSPGGQGGPLKYAKGSKANVSPKMVVTDEDEVQKDKSKYEQALSWKERMEATRKQKLLDAKETKTKAKAKMSNVGRLEHDEKQAQVRQKVDKVQGFDDAIATRIEQESAFDGKEAKMHAGGYFKRLDKNAE